MRVQPLVSIVTPFLDPGQFLLEAAESVLAQSWKRWELLLVDDGSTDESVRIAARYADRHPEKIRLLQHPGRSHAGASASLNLGIRHARGDYITFLDADDVYEPWKLSTQIAVLESNRGAAATYANALYWYSWDGNGAGGERDFSPDLGVPVDQVIEPPGLLTVVYPLGTVTAPTPSSVMVRRDAMDRVGGFADQIGVEYSDQSLLVKLYAHERLIVTAGSVHRYRQHPGSSCATMEREGRYRLERRVFLNWMRDYFRSLPGAEASVLGALDAAIAANEAALADAGLAPLLSATPAVRSR